jgi:hypothetical protein
MNNIKNKFFACAAALGIITTTVVAFANTSGFYDGTLSVVQYSVDGTLLLQMPSTSEDNFVAPASSPCAGISAASADTRKIWLSMGQAALLSGKTVRIYWSKCTGGTTPYITILDLTAN